MKLTSEAIYFKQIVILQKAWPHSKCLFSVEWFPIGWLVCFFDGVENIRKVPIIDAGFSLISVYSYSFCWVPEQKFTVGRDRQVSLAIWQLVLWQPVLLPPLTPQREPCSVKSLLSPCQHNSFSWNAYCVQSTGLSFLYMISFCPHNDHKKQVLLLSF